jgi:hypothetical protein
MQVLTRDQTEHDVDYVTLADAREEIASLEIDIANLRNQRLDEGIAWLKTSCERWYGPRDKWTYDQQADYEKHLGFLVEYLSR